MKGDMNENDEVLAYGHQMTNGASEVAWAPVWLQAKAPGGWRTPRRYRVHRVQTGKLNHHEIP